MSVNPDGGKEVPAHGVEVEWDRDELVVLFELAQLLELLLALLLVHPLEVNVGKIGLKLLSKLEAGLVRGVLCTLHRHASQDEALGIFLSFLFREVDFKLQFELFQGPVVVLRDSLSRCSEVSLRVKETSVPEALLAEIAPSAQNLELLNTLDEVIHPDCDLDVGDSVLAPLWRNRVSVEFVRKLLELLS